MSAFEKARSAAVEGIVAAARYCLTHDGSGGMSDGRSVEDSWEDLTEAVHLLDRIEGRPLTGEK